MAAIAKRIDAARVPERAFKAADWMRAYVIARYPSAYIARQPWGSTATGDRLVWARELAVIAEPRPIGRDGRTWTEVWKAIKWLFEEQTGEYPIIVQSPTAMREKWGKIQAAMRRKRLPERKPAQPVVRRTFTRWDEGWPTKGSGDGK